MKHAIQTTILTGNGAVSVAPAAQVEIRNPEGQLVPLWLDRDGDESATNPFYADSRGFFRVYAAAGRYHVTASSGGQAQEWRDVLLGSAAGYDIDTLISDAVSAVGLPSTAGTYLRRNAANTAYEARTPQQVAEELGVPDLESGLPSTAGTYLRRNAANTAYEALTPQQVAEELAPLVDSTDIGGYREVQLDLEGATEPDPARYIRLAAGLTGAGQYNEGKLSSESVSGSAPLINATAVVSDPASPLNGETVRLLETERRMGRPGNPGEMQDDAFQAHRHGGNQRGFGRGGDTGLTTQAFGTPTSAITAPGSYPEDSDNGTPRTANETRPRNIGVAVYMRIK